jgi:hypothetical protein
MLSTMGMISTKVSEASFKGYMETFMRLLSLEKGKRLMSLMDVDSIEFVTSDDVANIENLIIEQATLRKQISNQSIKGRVAK